MNWVRHISDFALLFFDATLWEVTGRSLFVSLMATLISMNLGLILARCLLQAHSRWAKFFDALLGAFVAIPAVVIGLLALLFFSSSIFKESQITLTIVPMMLAQALLLTPLAATLCLGALRAHFKLIGEELVSLGASNSAMFNVLIRECWPTLIATSILVFSRGIAEVGTVLIIGGNVEGRTQVLTTLIAEKARIGIYEQAIALSLILIFIALILSLVVRTLQKRFET